jgi:hypothetical protein
MRMISIIKEFHIHGVIHGDPYQRNVILPPIEPWDCVLVDFGFAYNPDFPANHFFSGNPYIRDGMILRGIVGMMIGFRRLFEWLEEKQQKLAGDKGWLRLLCAMRHIEGEGENWVPIGPEEWMRAQVIDSSEAGLDYTLTADDHEFLRSFVIK